MRIKLEHLDKNTPPVILEFEGTMKEWIELQKQRFIKYEFEGGRDDEIN